MSAVEAVETSRPLPAGSSPELVLQGLYERHSERIFGFCLRRLRTRPEAEDAVQNTFLQAFRALQRGVVPLCEHAWLFKIAENVCLTAHRSNGRRREHELGHDPDAVDGLTAGEDRSETARDLERALAALPETQRRALLLREWRGLSYREIATQLGTSVAAVETLIFRARRGVARALGEAGVKGRLAGVLNLGSLFGPLKAALSGATAAKLAAAAAVLTVAALPAGDTARSASPSAAASAEASSAESGEATARASQARTPEERAAGGTAANGQTAPSGRQAGADHVAIPGSESARSAGQSDERRGGDSSASTPGPGTTPPSLAVEPSLPVTPAVPLPAVPPPPAVPPVEVPQVPLPQLPALPQAPELPKLPELPAAPELPQLPVQPPDLEETLPELPKLP